MKKILAAGALALMGVAGSAQAAPTIVITFNGGSGVIPAGETIIQNFEGFAPNSLIGTNAFAANDAVATRPAFGSTGLFGVVGTGGSFTQTFSTAAKAFSFVLGSLDAYNSLTLFFGDGTSTTLTGGQINGDLMLGADGGSRTATQVNGVVTYTVAPGASITGATFASSANSFEFDNLAILPVPETAIWGMMIMGFAMVGTALRRRPTTKVTFA